MEIRDILILFAVVSICGLWLIFYGAPRMDRAAYIQTKAALEPLRQDLAGMPSKKYFEDWQRQIERRK